MSTWKGRLTRVLGSLGLSLTLGMPAYAQSPAAEVKKIFQAHCLKCHNSTPDADAGLDILNHEALTDKEGKLVVPGNPEQSKVFKKITLKGGRAMPPPTEARTAPELDIYKGKYDGVTAPLGCELRHHRPRRGRA